MSGRLSSGTTGAALARVGAIDGAVGYDEREYLKRKFADSKSGAALYPHEGIEEVFNIAEREPLFARKGTADGTRHLKVLSCLNGAGVKQAQEYPDDPASAIVALKNQLMYAGVAVTQMDRSVGDTSQGLTAAFAGLNTMFANRTINPGDRVRLEMPSLSLQELTDGFTTQRKGIHPHKYPMITAAVDYKTLHQTLQVHISNFLKDPQKWRTALGPELESTKQWDATVLKIKRFGDVAGHMYVYRLLQNGIMSINPGKGFTGRESPEEAVTMLAQFLEVVKSRRDVSLLDRTQRGEYVKLSALISGSIFTDGTNPTYEFGFSVKNRSWDSAARNPDTGKVVTSTPIGQLLHAQLNAFAQAIGGINAALAEDRRWEIGRCVRGAEPGRSFDIALGVH